MPLHLAPAAAALMWIIVSSPDGTGLETRSLALVHAVQEWLAKRVGEDGRLMAVAHSLQAVTVTVVRSRPIRGGVRRIGVRPLFQDGNQGQVQLTISFAFVARSSTCRCYDVPVLSMH